MSYRYQDDPQERRTARPVRASAPSTVRKRAVASGEGQKSPSARKKSASAQRPSAAGKRAAPVQKKRPAPQRRRDYDDYYYAPRPAPRKRPRRRKKANPLAALLLWLIAIALAFALSYFVRQYGFEIIRVSGDGMYQTLMDGDLALVTKFDYKEADPQRGDVVAVSVDGSKGVILRRVVGLPGETVEIIGGETMVNGSKLLEQYIGLETYDTFEGKTMPPGKYYLLGDNRTEVNDSRDNQIGMVDQEDILGKVHWIIWPLNHLGSL